MAHPDLTVVVPAGGRQEHLARCLTSLRRSTIQLEVIVVDLLADAGVVADGADRVLPCRPHRSGALRIGEARNIGAAAATSERLCFLDVDCVVEPWAPERWLDALHAFDNALLAPPVRYLREGWSARLDTSDPVGTPAWIAESDASDRPRPAVDTVATYAEYDLFWSLAFCCTSSTFVDLGGFDSSFVGYGAEDTDFARRARRRSTPFVWLAAGVAYHQYHPPTRLDPSHVGALVANATRFRRRWGTWPMRGWLDELAAQGLVEWDAAGDRLRPVAGRS